MVIVDDLINCVSEIEQVEPVSNSLLDKISDKHKPQCLIVGTSRWRVDENGKPECLEAKIERLI